MIKKFFSFIWESIVPLVIITISIVVSLTPQIGNFTFDTNNVIMALFSLLAIDSIVDKAKSKKSIIDKTEIIENHVKDTNRKCELILNKVESLEEVKILKKRSDFARLELIINNCKSDLFISGVNLEGIVPLCSQLKRIANRGVKIRLLLLNPDGKRLIASSDMSGVGLNDRKKKIRANINYLKKELAAELAAQQIILRKIDAVLPASFICIDVSEDDGLIIVQNYLYQIPSSNSLMLELTHMQNQWYSLYANQIELQWNNAIDC